MTVRLLERPDKEKQGKTNVLVYVLEFLLDQHCSSDDEAVIEKGMQNVIGMEPDKLTLVTIFFVLLLSVNFMLPVFAADDIPRLVDEADLLSDDEEMALTGQLNEISERQQVDIVVVTVNSLEGAGTMEFADDFYDYNGYGFGEERDGILFLISMEERDWYISTTGYGITAVTDAGREYVSDF